MEKENSRLLTEVSDILHRHYYPTVHEQIADATLEECAKEVIAKITFILKAQEQARVEELGKKIEDKGLFKNPEHILLSDTEWQTIKKQEGIESE